MTVKDLIKRLKTYNQNAEVRVIDSNGEPGDTRPASIVDELDQDRRVFGFAQVIKKKKKEKINKIIIA